MSDNECVGNCLNIIDDVCQDCGCVMEDQIMECNVKFQSDDTYVVIKPLKKEPFNYYDKLSSLDLNPKVCANVCEQISRLKEKSHVRVNTHLKNLFVMIYIAYNQEGIEFNHVEIGRSLGLDDKCIREAIKIASVGIDCDADKNPVCIISPYNFIREICKMFTEEFTFTEEIYYKLEKFIELVMSNNKMLGNENPRGIAATVLKMFFDERGISPQNFMQKTGRTPGYIKIRENIIIKTLNQLKQY